MPRLLGAGLRAFAYEFGERGRRRWRSTHPRGPSRALHARLRLTLDERTEDEVHWSFRAIAADHPIAVLSRLRSARTEAQLRAGGEKRNLVLLRNKPLSGGPKTRADPRRRSRPTAARRPRSARTTSAPSPRWSGCSTATTRRCCSGWPPGGRRRGSELFRRVLPVERIEALLPGRAADPAPEPAVATRRRCPTATRRRPAPVRRPEPGPVTDDRPLVPTGRSERSGEPVSVPLEALRKHTAIFAGSGSGKTVLLRRLVEECALHGVSSIVLDPNNDLARLGDAWPQPPAGWAPGDADRAAGLPGRTPRSSSGRRGGSAAAR